MPLFPVCLSVLYTSHGTIGAGSNMCGLQMISLANMSGYYATIRDFFAEESVYLSSSISIDEMEITIINST